VNSFRRENQDDGAPTVSACAACGGRKWARPILTVCSAAMGRVARLCVAQVPSPVSIDCDAIAVLPGELTQACINGW